MYFNSRKKIWFFVLLVALIIFAANYYYDNFITNTLVRFYGKASIEQKNIDVFLQQNIKLKYLEYENSILKNLIKNTQNKKLQDFTVARQVKTPGKDLYKFFYIILEDDSNVYLDDLVVDEYGFAVGRILDIKGSIAKVEIFSAPKQNYNAITQNKVSAQIIGHGSGNFLLQLPTGFSVKEGELVFIPDSAGYPIAIVYKKAKTNDVGAFSMYLARIPKNIDSQTHFFVLKGSGVLQFNNTNEKEE